MTRTNDNFSVWHASLFKQRTNQSNFGRMECGPVRDCWQHSATAAAASVTAWDELARCVWQFVWQWWPDRTNLASHSLHASSLLLLTCHDSSRLDLYITPKKPNKPNHPLISHMFSSLSMSHTARGAESRLKLLWVGPENGCEHYSERVVAWAYLPIGVSHSSVTRFTWKTKNKEKNQ